MRFDELAAATPRKLNIQRRRYVPNDEAEPCFGEAPLAREDVALRRRIYEAAGYPEGYGYNGKRPPAKSRPPR